MVPSFEKAAFTQAIGGTGEVAETQFLRIPHYNGN